MPAQLVLHVPERQPDERGPARERRGVVEPGAAERVQRSSRIGARSGGAVERVDWISGTAAGCARHASRRPWATPRMRCSHGPSAAGTIVAATQLGDAVQQRALVRDVPVERHRRDAEAGRHAPHAHGLRALGVEQGEGRGEDAVAVERHGIRCIP